MSLAAPGVRGLKPYQPGKSVEELEREQGLAGAVKLASNENPLGPSPLVVDAIHSIGMETVSRYPDGNGFALRRALAGKLGVSAEQITLGNGSNELLELAARTFVTDRHQIIYSQHSFAVYSLVTQAIGAEAAVTPALGWGNDLDAMAKAIGDSTRLIFIANPNNPTGTWVELQALSAFLDSVPSHVIVVMDEAYHEYVDAPDYPDSIAMLSDYPNMLVTRTFSKIHGLAGLRIGYGVSRPEVAELLNRVRQPFNVNGIALAAAEAALKDVDHVFKSRSVNKAGLVHLADAFDHLGLPYIPSVGNFISVDVKRPAGLVYETLLKKGVITRPIANYGLPNHLRVTVGTEEENRRFIEVLAEVLTTSEEVSS